MKTDADFEAKNRFSELLAAVEHGEEITITRHGCPVAPIFSANAPSQTDPGQRRGDLAKMKHRDIKDGCLNVIQQKNKRTDEVGHKVAIPMELAIAGFSLQATVARTKNVVSQYLIDHTKQAGRAKIGSKVRDHSLALEFARLRERVGIVGENPPTLHEVRSLSARLYTEKYGKEFANAMLGHKSAKMTELYLDERDGWFRPRIAM